MQLTFGLHYWKVVWLNSCHLNAYFRGLDGFLVDIRLPGGCLVEFRTVQWNSACHWHHDFGAEDDHC